MKYMVSLLLLSIGLLSAQDLLQLRGLNEAAKAAKKSVMQLPEPPQIEAPVDEQLYRVGPGDVFSLTIAGRGEEQEQLMVTPEGSLVLPAVGPVPVAGLTLQETKQKIRRALAGKFLTEDIILALVQLRTFRVTVSGAVYYPGLVTVNAMNRVSDAVLLAGGLVEPEALKLEPQDQRLQIPGSRKPKIQETLTDEQKEELERKIASKRNVIVRRRDGTTVRADLLLYELAGIAEANPFLLDGDVVVVMPQTKEVGQVAVYGAVRAPIVAEYIPGDCIGNLLRLARGFRLDADSSKVQVARFEADGKTVRHFEVALDWNDPAALQAALETPIRPDDRLFVRARPDFHRKRTVEIRGEVVYPGEYPLIDRTTLTDLIAMAGGFTPQAMLNGAYVQRRSMENEKDREFERLDLMISVDMEKGEKAYYRERARELKGLVSVDFTALFLQGKKEKDIELQDQDLIVVPAVANTVYVVGQVRQPGLLPYAAGRSWDYYIEKAGGYTNGAWKRRIKIKKAGSGELLSPKKTVVEMGDMILVPEKVEKDFWETFRDVAVVTTQLATMVMVITQINYWTSRK